MPDTTIYDEINRLTQAKADIKSAIESKGVTVSPSLTLDAYPNLIASIGTSMSGLSISQTTYRLSYKTGETTKNKVATLAIPAILNKCAIDSGVTTATIHYEAIFTSKIDGQSASMSFMRGSSAMQTITSSSTTSDTYVYEEVVTLSKNVSYTIAARLNDENCNLEEMLITFTYN